MKAISTLAPYAIALAAVMAMSAVIGLVLRTANIANLSMLYLIVILATAARLGRGPAIFASLVAFLAFDWFFVEPVHQFTIGNAEELVSLVLFLITAIITGQLAAGQARRALEAERREREAVLLFDALRLMGDPDIDAALHAVAERVRAEMRLAAASIDLTIAGVTHVAALGDAEAAAVVRRARPGTTEVLGTGPKPTSNRAGAPGRWIKVIASHPYDSYQRLGRWRRHDVPVRVDLREVGGLTLLRDAGAPAFGTQENRFLAVIAIQLGLLVQRAELRQAATEAELLRQANELKTALLNAVSHDLRTPLASIMASAGSLRQRDVHWTDEERDEFAEAIEQQSERLNRIVGNLLDLSRIEAGVLLAEKALHEVDGLIDDVLGRLRPLTARHHLTVRVEEELAPALLDYVQIDQVLSNLVENAVKYAPAGTEIEIGARRAGPDVLLEVSDQGPGIPPQELERVFEPFYRVRGAGPGVTGLGVGLAVARGLVEAHGGRIWAENRAGGGARFAFTLPMEDSSVAEPSVDRVAAT